MKSKRVKRIAIGTSIVAVLVALVFGIMSALGINLFSCSKNIEPGEAPDSLNISESAPTDGSLPTAHTGIENISYMVSVLSNQTSWHSYSETVSEASINHQMTYTYKDYKDGVLIASDMTSSSFVKSSTQTAYIGDGAYTRTGSEPSSTDITEIVWNDGEPEYLQRQAYYEKYGLFANEISVFLLNEETVSSCGEVIDNGDGTYTQSFTLDPSSSTYYYQFNMKTRGGLSSYPEFETVNITFTFDAQWQVLRIETYEVAKVSMGVINTTNTSESVITFTYGDDAIDEYNYAFYESYFKQYVGNVAEGSASDTDGELGVTEVLQYGFGEVLSGGKQYQIDVILGENKYTGYIYASVDLETLSADTLGSMDIRLSLGKTLNDQMLYLELSGGEIAVYYSDSFAVSANLSELSLVIDEISSFISGSGSDTQAVAYGGASGNNKITISKITTSDEGESDDDALTQLLSLFEVTETENGATLSLITDDLLGTGIGISAVLEFSKNDESVLTFTGASVQSLSYGGEELNVNVVLSDTEAEVITRDEEKTPANLADFVADVYDLLSADLLEISIAMDGDSSSYAALGGLKVEATALLDINSVVVGADLGVSYTANGANLSAKIAAYYNYSASEYGEIYLKLYELCGKSADVKLCCDISELVQAINILLGSDDGEDGAVTEEIEEVSQSVAQIINSLLSLDFSTVITQLYAMNGEIRLGVNLDQIMALLGADGIPALGTAALVYGGENLSLSLAALGLSINVAKSTGDISQPEDSDSYLDLTQVITGIYDLINSVTITADVKLDESSISYLEGVSLGGTIDYSVESGLLKVDLTASYNGISATLAAYYDGEAIYIYVSELCGAQTELKVSGAISDLSEIIEELLGGTSTELTIATDEVLETILALDFGEIITTLEASAQSGINIAIDADELLAEINVDLGVDLGVISLGYNDGVLEAQAEYVGLTATVCGSEEGVALPADTEDYLDISKVIVNVTDLVNSRSLVVELQLGDSSISYLEGVELEGTVKYTVSNGVLRVNFTASYQNISAALKVYYDGENIYLSITELCGAATDVKVKCGINEISSLLEDLLGDTSTELSVATDEVLETILALDFGEIITQLKANAEEGITLGVDIDSLLSQLEADLGIELGEVVVSYNETLEITAEYAGLTATLSGSDSEVSLPADTANYLDIANLISEIEELLNSETYDITITLDGNAKDCTIEQLSGITAEVSAKIDISQLQVYADVSLAYGDISAKLEVYYSYAEQTYGTAYVRIYELCGTATDVRISGTISEVLELIGVSLDDISGGTQTEITLEEVLNAVLSLDFGEIITELKVGADSGITVGINVDSLLSQLETELGISLGEISASYNNGSMAIAAANLGISAKLCGSNEAITFADEESYLDIATLVENIKQFISSETFTVEIAIENSNISYLEDVTICGTIDYSVESGILKVDLTASYKGISITLAAYYDGEDIYINITNLCGAATDVKVKCGIDEISSLLESLLGDTSTELTVATDEVLETILALDFGEIITTLKANAEEGITLGVDIDSLLTQLEVNLGIGLGEVAVSYNNELEITAETLGLTASVYGSSTAIIFPADTASYLDIATLVENIKQLISSETFTVEIAIENSNISYVEDVTVGGTINYSVESGILKVELTASYQNISAALKVYYDGENIYLAITELCGTATDVKVKCGINEISSLLEDLLGDTSTELTIATDEVLETILALDFGEIITQLKANAEEGITLGVDIDSLLTQFEADLGIELGEVVVSYNETLEITADYAGLTATLSGSDSEVSLPADIANYLDIAKLISEIEELLNSETYDITITLDGNSKDCAIEQLSGITAELNAKIDISQLQVYADVSLAYGDISAKLEVYYSYAEQTYGTAYVRIYELCGTATDVRVSGTISEVLELIGVSLDDISGGTQTDITLEEVLNAVLSLDFGEIITELKVGADSGITVGINVDSLLSQLETELGISLGEINASYNNGSMVIAADSLGVSAKLCGSNEAITFADEESYLDIATLVENITELINSRSIVVDLSLDDSSISYLDGVTVDATIKYTIESGALRVNLTANYRGASVTLRVYYDGENIYLSITELCGVSTSIKVKCGIDEISSLIESLLGDTSTELSVATDEVLETILALDFGEIITRLKANASDGITLGVDIDSLLSQLEVNLGIGLGEVVVSYNNELDITAETLGLTASVYGSSTAIIFPADLSHYLDIAAAAKDIINIISSDAININVSLDGGELLSNLVDVDYLNGLFIEGDISIATGGSAILADLEISYTEESDEVSLCLQVYYDGETVYLLVDEINGVTTSIGVSCTVETLNAALTKLLSLGSQESNSTQTEQTTADIITILLAMDYSKIINEFTAYNTTLKLSVDVDSLLSQLYTGGIISADLSGISLGEATLTYSLDGKLHLTAETLGLDATLSGENNVTLACPDANYLTVESVLQLIESAENEVEAIEAAQAVSFTIDCYATVDGLTLGIKGSGEVDWSAESGTTVALDLTLRIQDGSSKTPDEIAVRVLYSAEGTITIAVGELKMVVTQNNISGLQSGFEDLLEAICTLAGVSTDAQSASNTVSALADTDVSAELEALLESENMSSIITALLGMVSSTDWVNELTNFSLSVNSTSALLTYLSENTNYTLNFTADGGFVLTSICKGECGNENNITVKAGTAGVYADVKSAIANYTTLQVDQSTKLTEVIYNFGLGVISNASIANTLGTNTYEIAFTLTGDYTGVEELQGVTVSASLYYTDSVTTTTVSGSKTTSKLTEMDVDIDAGGVTAVFNIIYYNESLYITLTELNGTTLGDLKLAIALEDVYDLADQLVEVLLNTNLVDMFSTGSTQTASEETEKVTEEAATTISGTLVTLLTLDFSKVIGCASETEEGVTTRTAWVNIDKIYSAFASGKTLGLGTVTAQVIVSTENKTSRKITATGVYDKKTWLSFTANRASTRSYTSFDTSDYWDLAFVNYLVADAIKTATNNSGEIYDSFTFSGTLTAGIDLSIFGDITIKLELMNCTIGYDTSGSFYVSMIANLSSETALGFTVAEASTIGLTYSNGYITLARKLGTLSAQFKIVSIAYFTDYLLASCDDSTGSDSPLRWLLGTSSTIWNLIVKSVGASLSSGVTGVDTLNLTTGSGSSTSSAFYLSDYITGINTVIGGSAVSNTGDNNAAGKLSLTNNYYAIDFNNNALASLTGKGITELYAALLRDDTQGIYGLTACGKVGGVLDFNITLNNYLEGVTDEYDITSTDGASIEKCAAPDMWAQLTEYLTAKNITVDYEDQNTSNGTIIFGCFTYTLGADSGTTSTQIAPESYNLYVYYPDSSGNYTDEAVEYTLKYGSTINFIGSLNRITVNEQDGTYVYYYYNASGEKVYFDSITFDSNTFGTEAFEEDSQTKIQIYAEFRNQVMVYYYDTQGNLTTSQESYEGAMLEVPEGYTMIGNATIEGLTETTLTSSSEIYIPVKNAVGKEIIVTGTFVVNEYRVNGVIYTFCQDNGGYYYISGTYKYSNGSMLVLENAFGDYKVTEIAEYAFSTEDEYGTPAFASGGNLSSVTTLIVPENITTIGGRAFYNCTNLQTVVFLADSIYMDCTVYGDGCGEPQGYAFWGCDSSLTVYYTNVTADDHSYSFWSYTGTTWCWSYSASYNVSSVKYTPNVVNTVSSGWQYIESASLSGTNDSSLQTVINNVTGNYTGVSLQADVSIGELETAIKNAVDSYTLSNYDYVGAYRVDVGYSDAFSDGRYIKDLTVTVSLTGSQYYMLTVSDSIVGGTVTIEGGESYPYDNQTYYKAGAAITLSYTQITGYEFEYYSYTSDAGSGTFSGNTFTMPSADTTVGAEFNFTAVYIDVVSAISFEYTFGSYTANDTIKILWTDGAYLPANSDVTAATGYYLIGWAQVQKDGSLAFVGSDVKASSSLGTIYAIWGYTTAGTVYTINSDNTTVTATNSADSESNATYTKFYAWYDDAKYSSMLTEGFDSNTITISTSRTVLVARWQFTLSYSRSGSSGDTVVYWKNGSTDNNKTTSFDVLEGNKVTVSIEKNSYKINTLQSTNGTKCVITITDDSGSPVTYTVFQYKSSLGITDRYYNPYYSSGWVYDTENFNNSNSHDTNNTSSEKYKYYGATATVASNLTITLYY